MGFGLLERLRERQDHPAGEEKTKWQLTRAVTRSLRWMEVVELSVKLGIFAAGGES